LPISWVTPKDADTKALFTASELPDHSNALTADWDDSLLAVLSATVNRPNTRILATCSNGFDISIRLWSTVSGTLLFEKKDGFPGMNELVQHVNPAFSDDGERFAVFSEASRIDILDARTPRIIRTIVVKPLNLSGLEDVFISAIAIGRDDRNIAVHVSLPPSIEKAFIRLSKALQSDSASKRVGIDVARSNGVKDVSMAYLAGGQRLFVAGRLPDGVVYGYCFNARTSSCIHYFPFGFGVTIRAGPVHPPKLNGDTCVVVKCRYNAGENFGILWMCSPEGRVAAYVNIRDDLVLTGSPTHVIMFRPGGEVMSWDSKTPLSCCRIGGRGVA
jgi:WD40 repeat protein